MSPDRDETHDAVDELKYPSPTAEPTDAGPFYHTNGQDRSMDGHDGLNDADANKDPMVVDHDQTGMHQSEDPTQQHHISRPSNLEELQLAAQLGHGLAGTAMMQATDPNMSVEDPSLRNMLPPEHEHEHEQNTSYMQEAPTADHMVTHGLAVNVPGALQSHFAMADNIPPRKRSKVSRACDECRRKKIKCDAQSDLGEAPCSSCARSSIRCLFSRVPQKRGPSKGYIKELADRIHSIEHKLESEGPLSHEDLSSLFNDRPRQGQSVDDANKKRPFSSISGDNFDVSGRQPSWSAEPRGVQPVGAADGHTQEPSAGSETPAADAAQHTLNLEPQFALLAQHQLGLLDREWVEGVDNFRNSYMNEVPLLREENANLRAQLETNVSRINALEQQLKELLESITGARPTQPVPEPLHEPMHEPMHEPIHEPLHEALHDPGHEHRHVHQDGHEHGHEPETKQVAIDMTEKVSTGVIDNEVVNSEAIM